MLPDWLTGLVAGGAALCAIVVLCGSALGIGSLVSRNIIRGIPAEKQRTWGPGRDLRLPRHLTDPDPGAALAPAHAGQHVLLRRHPVR
ncbi:hypothetical protein [Nocardioides sp. B-3]|uniref:hypothetical protein n=1 Tax=Nocardioides sp. B-3 TaxID=2895565 RepID=UPI0021532E55|nr:hypothetical protein [Nocardioides sp. B-3]UUZ59142.1 hypothetical protein LP418_24965 [Nocardioides sp. B-3]